jgi:trk system potassium uptake protein TrkH
MNYRLVCRLLGIVAWLIGATMLFSLPWAFPAMGGQPAFEWDGFLALLGSTGVCTFVGWLLRYMGRDTEGAVLYRKEAMAVVGISWVLATILGAMPYYAARTAIGRTSGPGTAPIHMSLADCVFESQSGFTTTGATVLTDLEDTDLVPRCILFWRSSTHFLGGLGIIVLFVAVLGHGSAGKALMRAEMPGPSKEGSHERMQHTAWNFALIYVALNVLLIILLKLEGPYTLQGSMSWFDAICHAFGTIATGGFSTYNKSVAHFDSITVDYTIIVFMILSGTNFALIYLACIGKPIRLLRDPEWRAYICWILGVTAVVTFVGTTWYNDFDEQNLLSPIEEFAAALRYGMFNIISIMTSTGYATHDFDQWNQLARSILFLSMFVGACAGSTSGGIKIIRHILFVKILFLEVEHAYRPSVVRHLRLGGEPLTDPEIRKNIVVYFGLVFFIFMLSWLTIVAIEDDATWTARGMPLDNKLIDVASGVISCFSNIGPGLGTVGATQNYSAFDWKSKLVLTLVMILGRLEVFPVVVLFLPGFWRSR